MKSFIKAYSATIVVINLISFANMLFITKGSLSSLHLLLAIRLPSMAIFDATLLLLMVVIGLPFFNHIQKRRDFSWEFSLFMWFIITIVAILIIQLTKGKIELAGGLWSILLISLVFGSIFSALYRWFKKRDNPAPANLPKVFR